MKQFRHIFWFEYLGYAKNKFFVILTAVLIALMAVVLFYPRFSGGKSLSVPALSDNTPKAIALASTCAERADAVAPYLQAGISKSVVTALSADEAALKEAVIAGTYDAAVLLESPTQYKYITETAALTDSTPMMISELLTARYQTVQMTSMGLSQEEVQSVMNAAVVGEPVVLGNDQSENFFYTYLLMFLLYFAVLMYGQFVAQSVATEKSSRAMELLITSAKPVNLMFGKVLGAGAAGFTQLVLLLGSAFVFFTLNKSYWAGNVMISSIFGMPLSMLLYTILFFVLGYFLYSFLYGALASLASRLEDTNTLVLPVTFMMIIAFMVTMFSMMSNVDSLLMKVASFIPFTSPMAMFTRISMGHVAPYEIVISVAILVLSTIGVGYLAAVIYRVGVLMYGKPPKLNEIVRAVQNNRQKSRKDS